MKLDETAHIIVVGDAMLDRYHEGLTSRISPEAPVPVLRVTDSYDRPGGCANVALNIATLGPKVTLLTFVGDDVDGRLLQHALEEAGVACQFQRSATARTIVKMRAVSMHQQMLRIDLEDDFAAEDKAALTAEYRALLASAALVVLSDYAKGALSQVGDLIGAARAMGVPVIVDPKGSDFERYRGATLLTPNEGEYWAAAGERADPARLATGAAAMRERLDLDALLVTRGEKGLMLVKDAGDPLTLPAEARDVFDVTGAGDTVVATLASALASGWSIEDATALANRAAGIVVGRHGTASVTAAELAGVELGIGNESAVLRDVQAARRRGERIVMTNGCFDILHAGHVSYLRQARERGDRLLVAVNSDASVARLKGTGRPFNTLAQRMEVLGALKAVDWVLPFGDVEPEAERDLPLRLIRAVRPDVLVKGADYTVATIVGAEEVLAWGGAVETIPLVEGVSTTILAQKAGARVGEAVGS